MRVMCDTNVLVRAAITPSGPAGELLEIIAQEHTLIVSVPHLAEVLEVLTRARIRNIYQLDEAAIRRFIAGIYRMAAVVSLPAEIPRVVLEDPKDDPIVMTAVVGKADVLCTLDQHLHEPNVVRFCADYTVRVL